MTQISRSFLAAGIAALMLGGLASTARAEMPSASSFLNAVNANNDKTISKQELDTYAKKRFADLEADKDRTLDQKELKGRLSDAGMAMADTDKDKTIDESEFVSYADKLFDEANVTKKPGNDHPTLTEKELGNPAGQKLIMLLR